MMKKILIITAAVLAFAGCAKEAAQVERITVDGKEYMSFKVVVADDVVSADDTKSFVNRSGVFSWEDGDKVYFIDNDGNKATGEFSESGSKITVEAGDWIAASTAQFISKTQLNFNNVKGPVIAAEITGSTLKFHHVGSVITLNLEIPIDCTLKFTASGLTWGNGVFSFDGDGKPVLGSGSTDVVITKDVTTAQDLQDITFTVPNLDYASGFKVNLVVGDNVFFEKSTAKAFNLSTRPTLLNMDPLYMPTYTVAGCVGYDIDPPYAALPGVFGNAWDPADTSNDLVLGSDGVYRKTYYEPSWLEFKVVENHAWGVEWGKAGTDPVENYECTTTTGEYTISFTLNNGISITDENITYTVAGVVELCGSSWAPTVRENDMEEVSTNVFHKQFTSVSAGTYSFKVVKNHNWGDSNWGADGDNFKFTTTAAGDVEIYFYLDIPSIKVVGWSEDYRIAGSDFFFGSDWDPADDNNLMEIQSDGTYSKSYPVADEHDWWNVYFKVTRDGGWGYSAPGSDYMVQVQKNMTLTIKYNPVTSEVTHDLS